MVMFYALVALCFSSCALAQIAGWGPCPKVESMQDVDLREGRWFNTRRYSPHGEMPMKCVTNDLLHGGGHGTLQMNTTAIRRKNGKMVSIKGMKVSMADPAEPGKIKIQLTSSEGQNTYWLLGGDPHDYAVFYNCTDLKLIHLDYVWIETRQQQPSKTVIDKVIKVMEKQKLDPKWLRIIDQTNCDAGSGSDESEGDDGFQEWHILY